jgi:tRNA threonylcarbamoyladenosine biosynthesis protein TsaB
LTLLGIDSSTPASAACVLRDDGERFEVAPEPARLAAGPAHARELLTAIADVMGQAGVAFGELDAIAVGVGPGTFTGLRIGIVTARSLAGSAGVPIRPVSSLAALAEGIDAELRLALIDARRGELFAALYDRDGVVWEPFVAPPEEVVDRARGAGRGLRAAGDGSIRFRGLLEAAGIGVDATESRSHVVRALHVCRLARAVPGEPPETVLPDYLRAPDAKTP